MTTTHQIHTVHSPDDGGYYAEIYERDTGKTIYTTEKTFSSERNARIAAQYWLEDYIMSGGRDAKHRRATSI